MATNFQLQYPDGSIVVRGEREPSDFTKKDEAIAVAKELSVAWQTPVVVKQTA